MVYREEYKKEGDCLFIRLTGELPVDLLTSDANVFEPLAGACKAHECRKVLIDARELSVDMNVMDIFKAGKDLSALTVSGLKAAFVAPVGQLDPLFEHVATNRGAFMRVFTDVVKAVHWLRKDIAADQEEV